MSLEAEFSGLTNEVANTRGWMKDVADLQREDHDTVIRMEGKLNSASERMGRVESDVSAMRGDLRTGLTGLRAAMLQDVEDLVERKLLEEREARETAERKKAEKQIEKGDRRRWTVVAMILSPILTGIVTDIIAWFAATGGGSP